MLCLCNAVPKVAGYPATLNISNIVEYARGVMPLRFAKRQVWNRQSEIVINSGK
jgi:hypothetical protein